MVAVDTSIAVDYLKKLMHVDVSEYASDAINALVPNWLANIAKPAVDYGSQQIDDVANKTAQDSGILGTVGKYWDQFTNWLSGLVMAGLDKVGFRLDRQKAADSLLTKNGDSYVLADNLQQVVAQAAGQYEINGVAVDVNLLGEAVKTATLESNYTMAGLKHAWSVLAKDEPAKTEEIARFNAGNVHAKVMLVLSAGLGHQPSDAEQKDIYKIASAVSGVEYNGLDGEGKPSYKALLGDAGQAGGIYAYNKETLPKLNAKQPIAGTQLAMVAVDDAPVMVADNKAKAQADAKDAAATIQLADAGSASVVPPKAKTPEQQLKLGA